MTDNQSKGKPPIKRNQRNVFRTSITMPFATRERLDELRGTGTFSEQIVVDLNAYWDAVRVGMQTLKHNFSKAELAYVVKAMGVRNYTSMKLSSGILLDIIEEVTNTGGPLPGDLKLSVMTEKLDKLTLLELMALVNLARTTSQLGEVAVKDR